jgi:hypothetical protein
MRLVYRTVIVTGSGSFDGAHSVLVENIGVYAATVAGKAIGSGESLSFDDPAQLRKDASTGIQFDYSAPSTSLEITYATRE